MIGDLGVRNERKAKKGGEGGWLWCSDYLPPPFFSATYICNHFLEQWREGSLVGCNGCK